MNQPHSPFCQGRWYVVNSCEGTYSICQTCGERTFAPETYADHRGTVGASEYERLYRENQQLLAEVRRWQLAYDKLRLEWADAQVKLREALHHLSPKPEP